MSQILMLHSLSVATGLIRIRIERITVAVLCNVKSFVFLLAPSAPLNLTVSNKTSHSIEVRWTKPLYSNGILLAYHLFYSGLESNNPVSDAFYHEKHIVMMYSMEEELKKELTGLVPYSMYNITIGAMNSAGLGNLSEATVVRTLHDGMGMYW